MAETSPLDFTQRLERKLAEYNASDNVFKRWLFEIMSWLLSATCMVAIFSIYVHLKDQPIVKGATILTWANVLGKISSAALIVPTSEALGQLKWNWFHNSQAMWDFEIFDKASRGPLGALMLLYRTKGRSLAAMGAFLILLLLAIDTFFQQVVDLPDRWALHDSRAALPRTTRYMPDLPVIFNGGTEIITDDVDVFHTVKKFAYNNGTQPVPFGNGTRPEVPLSCPTSNCTWPVYETFGVCSKCADVSSLLSFRCLTQRVDWTSNLTGGFAVEGNFPNATMCGYFLNATSQNPIMMSGYIADSQTSAHGEVLLSRMLPLTSIYLKEPAYGNGSIHFRDLRNTITDALIVSTPDGSAAAVYRNETPVAVECVLAWCVKTIQSSYQWGEYKEEVLETFWNTTGGEWPWSATPFEDDIGNGTDIYYLQDFDIDLGVTAGGRNISGYGISNTSINRIIVGFTDFIPSFTTLANESDVVKLTRYYTWRSDFASTRLLPFNPWLAPNNVTRHMERFATAMTNVMRSAKSREMLEGDAWDRETYISIRWAWLTFPLLLLILSLAFLVSTIIKTSKDTGIAVWKTSTMPTLIYSLPKESQRQFESSSTWNSAQQTKKVRIRLSSNTGWRVSGQKLRISSPRLPPPAGAPPSGWI